jgi:hypothetical protein
VVGVKDLGMRNFLGVRRFGIEWVHKLLQEPSCLWKRYTIVNVRYVIGLGLQLAGAGTSGSNRRRTTGERDPLHMGGMR